MAHVQERVYQITAFEIHILVRLALSQWDRQMQPIQGNGMEWVKGKPPIDGLQRQIWATGCTMLYHQILGSIFSNLQPPVPAFQVP